MQEHTCIFSTFNICKAIIAEYVHVHDAFVFCPSGKGLLSHSLLLGRIKYVYKKVTIIIGVYSRYRRFLNTTPGTLFRKSNSVLLEKGSCHILCRAQIAFDRIKYMYVYKKVTIIIGVYSRYQRFLNTTPGALFRKSNSAPGLCSENSSN